MSQFEFKPLRYRQRWFCYLDLLGFTDLVHNNDIANVMPIYGDVLATLKNATPRIKPGRIIFSWFSDTFILYSGGHSAQDFARIESVGRVFFERLIIRGVPVRGALTYGGLYSQSARNIFVGPALIDAYRYAENQDWLGFILTPRAIVRMEEIGLPIEERPFYRQVNAAGIFKHPDTAPVYGFAFNNGLLNGQNLYQKSLETMREKAGPRYSNKYDKTLAFLHAAQARK